MTDNWESKQERASIVWMRMLLWIAFFLGRRVVNVVLIPISVFYIVFARDAVAASKDYLSRILKRKISLRDVWRHFYIFSLVSVDRFYFVSGRLKKFKVEAHGAEIFEDLLRTKQGCLVLVSHIGSFDALRALGVASHNFSLKILMDYKHNPSAMALIDALNPELANAIIDSGQPPAKLALQLSEILRDGGMVGIMADRMAKEEGGYECTLLDGTVTLPAGPWQLAAVLKVPIVVCFGIFEGGNRYTMYIEKFSDGLAFSRKERKTELAKCAQAYADRMGAYLEKAPFNWFNFYSFWR